MKMTQANQKPFRHVLKKHSEMHHTDGQNLVRSVACVANVNVEVRSVEP